MDTLERGQKWPILDPRSYAGSLFCLRKGSKMTLFWTIFGPLFEAIYMRKSLDLGPKSGPKMVQKWSKNGVCGSLSCQISIDMTKSDRFSHPNRLRIFRPDFWWFLDHQKWPFFDHFWTTFSNFFEILEKFFKSYIGKSTGFPKIVKKCWKNGPKSGRIYGVKNDPILGVPIFWPFLAVLSVIWEICEVHTFTLTGNPAWNPNVPSRPMIIDHVRSTLGFQAEIPDTSSSGVFYGFSTSKG